MTPTIRQKILKRLDWAFLISLILMNFVAYFHAYKFTHFSESNEAKTKDAKRLSTIEKIKITYQLYEIISQDKRIYIDK